MIIYGKGEKVNEKEDENDGIREFYDDWKGKDDWNNIEDRKDRRKGGNKEGNVEFYILRKWGSNNFWSYVNE